MSQRLCLIAAALLTLAAGCFAAAGNAAPAAEVVQWLDKLEARGREIRDLQANIVYRKTNTLLQDSQVRTGHLTYAAATDDKPARFAIDFKGLVVNDTVKKDETSWVFDGQWLVEKQPERKLFIKRQVVAPGAGERLDPLAVDGPFPLPLGQKREDVLRRFHVELAESDKPELVHLKLTPREKGSRRQFEQVDMWIDRASLLPVEVVTLDDSENETRVQISKPVVNQLSADELAGRFDTTSPAPGSGWRVETTTFDSQ